MNKGEKHKLFSISSLSLLCAHTHAHGVLKHFLSKSVSLRESEEKVEKLHGQRPSTTGEQCSETSLN